MRHRRTRGRQLDAALVEALEALASADRQEELAAAAARAARRLGLSRSGPLRALARLASSRARAAKRAEVREVPLDGLVEYTSDVVLIIDENDRIRYASPSAQTLLGTSVIQDVPFIDLVVPEQRRSAEYLLRHTRQLDSTTDQGIQADLTVKSIDGGTARVVVTSRDLRSDDAVRGIVVTLRDVTGQRRLERELTRHVFRDQLTGLPNRLSLHDRIGQALAARRGVTGVLLLNLDHFRVVNEGLGRDTGDALLVGVARRLRDTVGAEDVVARVGGDEFAILTPAAAHNEAIDELADRVIASFAEPVPAGRDAVACGASIGVATSSDADTTEDLLRHADLALEAAKASGRGHWQRYEPARIHSFAYRLELRSALLRAPADGSLVIEYQPIVALATMRTVGLEALVRWCHPTRGLHAPTEFIDIAEESGFIVPIGEHVLASAIKAASAWSRIPRPDSLYVSVNLSVRQFRTSGFADLVDRLLNEAALPPRHLVLEITESLLLSDDDDVWKDLSRLRRWGVRIAIDDFGTGYSALGYLRQLQLDIVKLDRLFTSTMTTSDRQRELVHGIISLVRTLRLDVVAEGIETTQQRDMLAAIGCAYGQGFLFSPPISEADATRWLESEV